MRVLLNIGQSVAYRGYLITKLLTGNFAVSKDGYHISYALSVDDAKTTIDLLF